MEQPPWPEGRPPGYPREYERQVMLPGGRRVLIRPILPSDAPELAEALKTADADTLRRRFLGGPPRVTPALLAHLTKMDYVRRFALVAIDPDTLHGVAIAQYEPAGDSVAEIAIVVAPTWRRAGLGALLIQLLADAAPAGASTPSQRPTSPRTAPSPPCSGTPADSAPSGSNKASPNAQSHLTETTPPRLSRSRTERTSSDPPSAP